MTKVRAGNKNLNFEILNVEFIISHFIFRFFADMKITYIVFLFGFSSAQQWPNGFVSFRPRPFVGVGGIGAGNIGSGGIGVGSIGNGGVGTVSAGIAFPNLVAGPQRVQPSNQ